MKSPNLWLKLAHKKLWAFLSAMKLLALDISGSTGYAVFESEDPTKAPTKVGVVQLDQDIRTFGPHPFGFFYAAKRMAQMIKEIVDEVKPDRIVIEETNGSKNRFTQKFLEYLHFATIELIENYGHKIVYINTRDWRKTVGSVLSDADKKQNAKVSRAKQKARRPDGSVDLKLFSKLKKELGVRGKINKKHVTIRLANEMFDLNLKAKDDDKADAIILGVAYLMGSPLCNGE